MDTGITGETCENEDDDEEEEEEGEEEEVTATGLKN